MKITINMNDREVNKLRKAGRELVCLGEPLALQNHGTRAVVTGLLFGVLANIPRKQRARMEEK